MVFKWLHPEYLWIGPALFLLVLISAIIFQRWRERIWTKLGVQFRNSTMVKVHLSKARFYTRNIALAIALLFLGLSLANLQMGGQKQKVQRKGADVVFALDVSRSMLAEDIAPSRLEKAKLLISRTIEQLGGDRVGIVAYAGSAYPALPITTDYAAAKMALLAADPDAVPNQGTNLAAALEYSWGYFNPASPAGRFVIVLTDGEDHESLDKNILPDFTVNTVLVGLGTTTGSPIPVDKGRNGTTYKKDRGGETVITRRDEATLSEIGRELGAEYIDGNRTENTLARLNALLEEGSKADIEEEIAIDFDDQFTWFLLPAFFFLLIYLILPARAGNPMTEKHLSNKATAVIAIFLTSTIAHAQEAPLTQGSLHQFQQKMAQGDAATERLDYPTAAQHYLEAAQMQPEKFAPMYNLGNTLLRMGEAEQSAGALGAALELAGNETEKSNTLYNLGNALMNAEQYPQAAEAYKKSLAAQPGRKDAMYNLSRALQKMQQQQQQNEQQDQQNDSDDNQDHDQNQQDDSENQNQKEDKDESENPKDDPMNQNDQNQDAKDQQNQDGESDPGQDEGQREENKPEEGGTSKAKMTPEEIKGLLEAIQRAEQKTAEKVSAKNAKGKKSTGEKDW
ncbi:MAG: hypothetical protein RL754_833 [Bacteroidota bacterium]